MSEDLHLDLTSANWQQQNANHCALVKLALFMLVALSASVTYASPDYVEPGFRVQTNLLSLKFPDQTASSLVFAGRNEDGMPMLGVLYMESGSLRYRELDLPQSAVSIDVGPLSSETSALYVLAAGAVYALNSLQGKLVQAAETPSLYRGRSFAELTSDLDFARDINGDDVAELLIPDFDSLHVFGAAGRHHIDLPSYRRGYDETVTYRAPTVAAAPKVAGGTLYSVRGNTLLSFDPRTNSPRTSELTLGLSNELERETFYNSYEDIDQDDVVLRELDRFTDINGDDLPDIVALETVSSGVFNKTTTYRIHHGQIEDEQLVFDSEADTVASSRGYQLGARFAPLDDTRSIMVSASVKVGVRAIIGALFTRAVTMQVEIHPPASDGTIASAASTTIKARVKFDFGNGQVEFPTIAFGDVDGDGINDLILKERKRILNWRQGTDDGGFDTRSNSLDVTGPADGTNVVLADLTGDGRDEVVVLYGRADGETLIGRVAMFRNFPGSR